MRRLVFLEQSDYLIVQNRRRSSRLLKLFLPSLVKVVGCIKHRLIHGAHHLRRSLRRHRSHHPRRRLRRVKSSRPWHLLLFLFFVFFFFFFFHPKHPPILHLFLREDPPILHLFLRVEICDFFLMHRLFITRIISGRNRRSSLLLLLRSGVVSL